VSAGRPKFVICPRCQLPNPIGPTTCWKCGAPLAAVALPSPVVDRPYPTLSLGRPSAPAAPVPRARIPPPTLAPAPATPPDYSVKYAAPPLGVPMGEPVERPRRLRRGRFLVGIVLLVIGLLLLAAGLLVPGGTTTVTTPAGSALVLTPSTLNSVSASISWSGGNATSHVYLVTGQVTCSSPSRVVAQATGATGSLSASLSSGVSYDLYACSGSSYQAMTFSYHLSGGISLLDVLAIVLLGVGVLLVVLAFRRPKERWE
jgi:hypothetical protein